MSVLTSSVHIKPAAFRCWGSITLLLFGGSKSTLVPRHVLLFCSTPKLQERVWWRPLPLLFQKSILSQVMSSDFCSEDQNTAHTGDINTWLSAVRRVSHFYSCSDQKALQIPNYVSLFFSTQSLTKHRLWSIVLLLLKNHFRNMDMISAFCSEDMSPAQTEDLKPVAFRCCESIPSLLWGSKVCRISTNVFLLWAQRRKGACQGRIRLCCPK